MDMQRRDKVNYYLDLAEAVSQRGLPAQALRRSDCEKRRGHLHGLCGGPRGRQNCSDLGYCLRSKLGIPGGSYELCPLRPRGGQRHYLRLPPGHDRATLYLVGKEVPTGGVCTPCAAPCASTPGHQRGIEQVIVRDDKTVTGSSA